MRKLGVLSSLAGWGLPSWRLQGCPQGLLLLVHLLRPSSMLLLLLLLLEVLLAMVRQGGDHGHERWRSRRGPCSC